MEKFTADYADDRRLENKTYHGGTETQRKSLLHGGTEEEEPLPQVTWMVRIKRIGAGRG